jgi:hypothetical protein
MSGRWGGVRGSVSGGTRHSGGRGKDHRRDGSAKSLKQGSGIGEATRASPCQGDDDLLVRLLRVDERQVADGAELELVLRDAKITNSTTIRTRWRSAKVTMAFIKRRELPLGR